MWPLIIIEFFIWGFVAVLLYAKRNTDLKYGDGSNIISCKNSFLIEGKENWISFFLLGRASHSLTILIVLLGLFFALDITDSIAEGKYFSKRTRTIQGEVIQTETIGIQVRTTRRNYRGNSDHKVRVQFKYEVEGRMFEQYSYTTGMYKEEGSKVDIEYSLENPVFSRIRGMNFAPHSAGIFLLFHVWVGFFINLIMLVMKRREFKTSAHLYNLLFLKRIHLFLMTRILPYSLCALATYVYIVYFL